MKTVIIILAIFLAFILGIMILGGLLESLWQSVGSIPKWLWFVGFLLFLIIWGINQSSKSNGLKDGASQEQNDLKVTEKEVSTLGKEMNHDQRFKTLVKSMRSPIRFICVAAGVDDSEPSIISPLFNHGMQVANHDGEQMGRIQLYQEIQTSVDKSIRVAEIIGPMRELKIMVQEKGWHARSMLKGRIIAVETFHPQWEGHQPIRREDGVVKGITYLDEFYPLYSNMEYSEDEQARDRKFRIEELLERQGTSISVHNCSKFPYF